MADAAAQHGAEHDAAAAGIDDAPAAGIDGAEQLHSQQRNVAATADGHVAAAAARPAAHDESGHDAGRGGR